MSHDLFDGSERDAATYERLLRRPAAERTYAIHFTPRSGSSWATDVLTSTGALSNPGECFNPAFVPTIARKYHASTLEQYVAMLRRRRNTGGVYGHEITWEHVKRVFGTAQAYMDHFRDSAFLWLRRRDIVAQAVSLSKKKQTRIGHAAHATSDAIALAESAFVYDEAEIARFLGHVVEGEVATERMWRDFAIAPVRLYYEDMTAAGAQALVDAVASTIGIDAPALPESFSSGHVKLGTGMNDDFADRFRRARPVAALLESRPPLP